ncbi:MAG: hypothetical protein LBC49_05225 [Bacteroidales bacterium]|jgi:hypothetical protein|nr:hypothetical protein [Bacteroidales bacterium]
MRKVLITIIAAIVLFAGCAKDGVFDPNGKIKKIYRSSVYYDYENPKELKERWTWDGDLLKKIEHIYNGRTQMSVEFQYDGKRVFRIIEDDDTKYVFEYKGSKIEKITIWYYDEKDADIEYIYKNSKIVEQKITFYDEFFGPDFAPSKSPLRFFVSQKMLYSLNKIMAKRNSKGKEASASAVFSYEYEKDNVKTASLVYTETDGEDTYKSTAKEEYTYDDKSNPFYNYPIPDTDGGIATQLSKNNCTKIIYSYIDEKNGVVVFEELDSSEICTYKYDDDLPVERTITSSTTSNNSTTYYYEY